MFSGTVTIFNYYEDSSGVATWFPHVLSGLHLETDMAVILKKTGNVSGDSVSLHVPFEQTDSGIAIIDTNGNGLKWLPPKAWKAQEEGELKDSITFAPNDFFFEGEWENDEPILDGNYTDRRNEGFYAWMNDNRDGVYKITKAQDYHVIPHFEIMGA